MTIFGGNFYQCGGSPDERACSKSLGKGIAGESFRCEITAAGCTGAECADYYHRQFLPLCASNHFHEIGLEPNFRIGDEGELKLLREDVMTGLFEQCYEGKHPGFLHLISCYGTSRSDAPVRDMIFKLYSYAQSYPWPKQWLREALSCYEIKTEQELEQAPLLK